MRRSIAIISAWGLGWLVYMVAMIITVYDGITSMIVQPIIGAIITTLAVGGSLIVGLLFRVPLIGRAWRAAWFLSPALAIGSIILMCFGASWGLTQSFTDPETGQQTVGLRSNVAISSFVVMVFAVANWPARKTMQPCAAPNDGIAEPLENSNAPGGPPSVS